MLVEVVYDGVYSVECGMKIRWWGDVAEFLLVGLPVCSVETVSRFDWNLYRVVG